MSTYSSLISKIQYSSANSNQRWMHTLIGSTELKLLIYHIRSMPTLGVLYSTFGVVEKGTNAPNIIHKPLL